MLRRIEVVLVFTVAGFVAVERDSSWTLLGKVFQFWNHGCTFLLPLNVQLVRFVLISGTFLSFFATFAPLALCGDSLSWNVATLLAFAAVSVVIKVLWLHPEVA